MATRYGYEYGQELVTKHGWKWAPVSPTEEFTCGDRNVIDPVTGDTVSPHEGRRRQQERDRAAAEQPTNKGNE